MLHIKNLTVSLAKNTKNPILEDISFEVPTGEIHALLGINGSGKSTLVETLMGHQNFEPLKGSAQLFSKELLTLPLEERFSLGLFLVHQHPVSIPGLSNLQFMRAALNAKRKREELPPLDPVDFLSLIHDLAKTIDFPEELLSRYVNEGFSGGEKKRNEILQMLLLEPRFVLLDELDSGLDLDAMNLLCATLKDYILEKNRYQKEETLISSSKEGGIKEGRGALVITHNPIVLRLLGVSKIHVLKKGRLSLQGDESLIERIEKEGYQFLE